MSGEIFNRLPSSLMSRVSLPIPACPTIVRWRTQAARIESMIRDKPHASVHAELADTVVPVRPFGRFGWPSR
ncbi:hypothetical protein [Burkholderia contaminans]|uniref:hypothetical protein n=1 Tax=Burkholderia contaminans TaxID=488447 RepID=UPI000A422D70|nr:hypothetical protein [Burkholderia contaminans]MEB4632477.1 hypothetical protein [Burkholderia contaminans]MEB4639374.1 hypothetical protein [Burkholderia contaminans]MEB4654030.1 hypothetical protein [Burkholderia contaminans]MEB4663681.1 hypothetical protein [Burkholderia contaminans]MEB4669272.1 hypothetical protein [Burkholderia contaminans]